MTQRPTKDQWAMALAQETAKRSTCLRRSVGCVLLDVDGRILSTGFNGVPAGTPHCNEGHACPGSASPSGTNITGCDAIHAEQNAIAFCQDVRKIDTCYVTASPCDPCTKLLLGTGCRRIVFLDEYPDLTARQRWEKSGRIWLCIKEKT